MAEASRRFAIPPSWIASVIHVESGGDARAVSPRGAMGLMQIMPQTWLSLRSRYHLGINPFDPRDNILGGTAYLRALYDRFGATGFLAAYNAGPQHFKDYLAGVRPLSDETKRYLAMLARMLSSSPIIGEPLAISNADNWRSASLFVSARAAQDSARITVIGQQIAPSSPDASGVAGLTLAPRSDGLFVPFHLPAHLPVTP